MYRVLLAAVAVAVTCLLVSPASEARTKRSSNYETIYDSSWSEPRRTRRTRASTSDEYSEGRSYRRSRSSRSNRGWTSERTASRSRGTSNRSSRNRRYARSYDSDGEWGSERTSRRSARSSQRARQRSARYADDNDDTGGMRRRAVTRFYGGGGGGASRSCLQASAQALLSRIEAQFGPMQVISTCRPGARVAGSGRPSKHAFGLAVDFRVPGGRKAEVVRWLAANHHGGGVMTYRHSSHIHVDIGYPYRSFGGR